MTSNLQNCTDIVPLLDAYHDGELADEEKTSVEGHLRGCETCSRQLAEIGKLVAALKGMPIVSLGEDFSDRFDQLLSKPLTTVVAPTDSKVVPGNFSARMGWVAAVAASFVVFFALQHFAFHSGDQIAQAPNNGNDANSVSKTLQKELMAQSKEQPVTVPVPIATSTASANSEHRAAPGTTPNASARKAATGVANAPGAASQTGTGIGSTSAAKNSANKLHSESEVAILAEPRPLSASSSSSSSSSSSPSSSSGAQGNPAAAPKHSLVAYYEPETSSIPEELGLSTDEDGLYAIKM